MNVGYKLNNAPIEYFGIQMSDHLSEGGSFAATKILEKVLVQYSETGVVTFSNDEFLAHFGKLGLRGLLAGFKIVENVGIVKRTYADPETKHTRTGFYVNIPMAIEWLSKTKDDVKDLKRGNPLKHFVMQSVIKIKMYARDLKKAIKHKKNELDRRAAEARIEAINAQNKRYELHCQTIIKKRERRIKRVKPEVKPEMIVEALMETAAVFGYLPPGIAIN